MTPAELGIALLWYLAFLASTTAHEAAHAVAALLGGDATAHRGGQVSLNPLPHMRREPFGMIVVPLLSVLSGGWCIGWASTPYDPHWAARHPRRAAWMAAAGPAANLVLALGAFVALRAGLEAGLFHAPSQVSLSHLVGADSTLGQAAGSLLSILLFLNVILCLFNLIPFPPLDGATALGLFFPAATALRLQVALRSGPAPLFGLLAAWILFGRAVPAVWSALLALVHPDRLYG